MNNSRKLNEIMVLVDGLRKALGVASSIDNGINLAVYDGDARVVKKYLSHLGAGGSGITDMVETYHFQLPIHTHNGQSQHLDARLPYERVALPDSMESLWDRRPSAPTQGRAAPAPPNNNNNNNKSASRDNSYCQTNSLFTPPRYLPISWRPKWTKRSTTAGDLRETHPAPLSGPKTHRRLLLIHHQLRQSIVTSPTTKCFTCLQSGR